MTNDSFKTNPLDSFLEESSGEGTDFDSLFASEGEPENTPEQHSPSVLQTELPAQVEQALQSTPAPSIEQSPPAEEAPSPAPDPTTQPTATLEESPQISFDPFAQALAKAEAQSDERLSSSFEETNPVFSYIKASEEITDREITFDQLREKYATDFPELDKKEKVSWTVSYGKVTKSISNPEAEKVFDIKSEIEKSKTFLDGIKKAKKDDEKNPKCFVKPRAFGNSKGERKIPGYKAYVTSIEAARASGKAITIIPSRSGKIFEMRKNDIGTFTAPAVFLPEFPEIESSFEMSLPKIPMPLLQIIISFFKCLSDRNTVEALAHILFNAETLEYEVRVPKQTVSHVSIKTAHDENYPPNLIHVMDVHSHHTMSAAFSSIDDDDEKATRLYGVIGKLDQPFPGMSLRASCGGKFIPLKLGDVFDVSQSQASFPEEWNEKFVIKNPSKPRLHFQKYPSLKEIGCCEI